MSIISNIFDRYLQALTHSQTRYEDIYQQNAEHAEQFYNDFLHSLILSTADIRDDLALRDNIALSLDQFFARRDIDFAAVDGTCSKDSFQDFIVFFGGAYGVKGRISLEGETNRVQYKRWSMDEDVSMVAYVPIPYAEVGDALGAEEDFSYSEADKIDLSNIHTRIMQLSEIYLAYQLARSSTIDRPRYILMDLSMSSVLMSTDVGMDRINLITEKGANTGISRADLAVAYSHPVSSGLEIPTPKKYRRYSYLVGYFHNNRVSTKSLEQLSRETNIPMGEWEKSLNESTAKLIFDLTDAVIHPRIDLIESWQKTVRFFERICSRMFQSRGMDAAEALLYEVRTPEGNRIRWMSPDDISFLVAIGIRALTEECLNRQIYLVGIVKDSSSRYFSRHYYGVMRQLGIYPSIPVSPLPFTDRTLLESIAFTIEELKAPWSTIEFDSCFMTLHLARDDQNREFISGMRGNIVNQEHLFARSLAQFFLRRVKAVPLAGHVIFIDRLLHPTWDSHNNLSAPITTQELGEIVPFWFQNKDAINIGQQVNMFLLDILCRNLFPEVIGYPDPLHKADWGAKSMRRRVDRLIKSSEIRFRGRPLSQLFRTTRDSAGR